MHCLMSLSSQRWPCALSGSVPGRVSEFRDAKGRLDCGLADVRFTPKKRTLLGDS